MNQFTTNTQARQNQKRAIQYTVDYTDHIQPEYQIRGNLLVLTVCLIQSRSTHYLFVFSYNYVRHCSKEKEILKILEIIKIRDHLIKLPPLIFLQSWSALLADITIRYWPFRRAWISYRRFLRAARYTANRPWNASVSSLTPIYRSL